MSASRPASPGDSTTPPALPIVTLTSDFGLHDAYVAQMKAALLWHCPAVRIIDVTHLVPPQDILGGSIALERAISAFPPGTIHVAVVDPGVGSQRRILVVQIRQQLVICPDNGLITWAWRRQGRGRAHELAWRPQRSGRTFHGRDIMAPAAGMLASGQSLRSLARPIRDPLLLGARPAGVGATRGVILHIDHFGNATTNVPVEVLRGRRGLRIRAGGHDVGPLRSTYADVAVGEPLALLGSSHLLEIAVRNGSAAERLSLHVGAPVRF